MQFALFFILNNFFILMKLSKSNKFFQAALNHFTKSLAADEHGLIAVVVCPGWVQTDMGGLNAALSIEESTKALVKIISQLKKEDSGKFLDRNGIIVF